MTIRKPDGGQAFPPSVAISAGGEVVYEYGMTVRDAAVLAALPAIITTCARDTREADETMEEMFVRKAGYIADAMIAARK